VGGFDGHRLAILFFVLAVLFNAGFVISSLLLLCGNRRASGRVVVMGTTSCGHAPRGGCGRPALSRELSYYIRINGTHLVWVSNCSGVHSHQNSGASTDGERRGL